MVRPEEVDRPWLLVVDDESESLNLVARSLRDDYHVLTARSGREALELLAHHDVAVVITDQRMPAMDGIELLRETMQRKPEARRILMAGTTDTHELIEAMNDGPIERLIPKPFAGAAIKRSVGDILELRRLQLDNRRLLQDLKEASESLRQRESLLDRELDQRAHALLETNRELNRRNAHLSAMARRDGLTNLYNYRTLRERLVEEVARSKRAGSPLSLIFGDLDNFKIYNQAVGHEKGDQCLIDVARILTGDKDSSGASGRASDIVSRYGGEEFVLLLPETDRGGARTRAERLRQGVESHRFPQGEGLPECSLTMSFGVASFPADANTADDLISRADEALFSAKRSGRNQVCVATSASTPSLAPHEVGSYRRLLPVLGSRLSADGALAVLSVTLTQLQKIETEYGSAMCRTLLGQLEEAVRKTSATFGNTPILGMCQDESKLALLIFLPGRVSSRCSQTADLSALAGRMEAVLTPELSRLERLIHAPGRVVVGWGEGLYSSRLPVDRLVAEVTVEAAEAAARRLASQQSDDRSLLRMLFVEKQLNFHFQPIVDQNLRRYGFEALVRGPAHLIWKAPDQMFARAAEVGLMDELDRGCCLGAIQEAAGRLGPDERLFLNLLPSTLHDQSFVAEELPEVLSASGISANRVVLEVTEQHAIESLAAFEESIRKVVDQGMSIALDDVGAGNSNLNALLEIRPSYIKLDRQLIQGVAANGLKRQLISALVAAADSMPAQLIAEGVEQVEDGEELKRLGVNLLQGYLFGRPLPFPERPIA